MHFKLRLFIRPAMFDLELDFTVEGGGGDDKKTQPLLSFLFIVAHPLSTNFYPSQAFVGAKIKDHSFNFHQENTEHLRLLCRLLCYVTQRSNTNLWYSLRNISKKAFEGPVGNPALSNFFQLSVHTSHILLNYDRVKNVFSSWL